MINSKQDTSQKQYINMYAELLISKGYVCFQNDQEQIVRIEPSSDEDGYYMRIIEEDEDGNGETYKEVDGGLCTGEAKDAVEWCMNWNVIIEEECITPKEASLSEPDAPRM